MNKFIVILLTVFIATGCVTSKKLYQKGRYDQALRKSVKKLRGNPEKTKEINILEKAFNSANEANNNRIKYLKTEGKPESWNEIFSNYSFLKDRQELVRTVLPLKDGSRVIDFPIIDYDNEIVNAKKNAAEYFYVHAKNLLSSNNRFKARDAYFELKKVKEYYIKTNKSPQARDFPSTFHNRFSKWNTLLKKAGIPIAKRVDYSDKELLEILLSVTKKIGHTPKRREFNKINRLGPKSGTYAIHFGSWNNALKRIDLKIIKGEAYYKEARDHKLLLKKVRYHTRRGLMQRFIYLFFQKNIYAA